MKKVIRILAILVAVFSGLALAGTWPAEQSFASRAAKYQRIQKTPEAELFGDIGEPIGSPQEYVVDDPKAILPGEDANGNKMLDENYLKENGYPVQLQTVKFLMSQAWIGAGVGLALGILGIVLTRRK